MKIRPCETNRGYMYTCRADLQRLLEQSAKDAPRPCMGCDGAMCDVPCPCSGSRSCICKCSSDCVHAPAQMSSEPDRYPIEPGVAPLVFQFYRLRVCPPCWSCEGHEKPCGGLLRIPRVWFYSHAPIYPRLIHEWLQDLRFRRHLNYAWQISITHTGNINDPAWSLEPQIALVPEPNLAKLQEDLRVIADNLMTGVREKAIQIDHQLESSERDEPVPIR